MFHKNTCPKINHHLPTHPVIPYHSRSNFRSDGICKLCLVNDESTCHLFYLCPIIQPVWGEIEGTIALFTNNSIIDTRKSELNTEFINQL